MALTLSQLLTKESQIKIEYPGLEGFILTLNYLSKQELQNIRKNSLITTINKKTRQPEQELDEEKFTKEIIKFTLVNWSGLKLKYLKELVTVDLSNQDLDAELPFSLENAELLWKQSTMFETWVSEIVSDVANFNKDS